MTSWESLGIDVFTVVIVENFVVWKLCVFKIDYVLSVKINIIMPQIKKLKFK